MSSSPIEDNLSSNEDNEDTPLSIELISDLGGTKDDFDLIKDVDDDLKCSIFKDDLDANPVDKQELRDLIKQLGFYKLKAKTVENVPRDLSKVKLAVDPNIKDETSDEESEIIKVTKKSKNKFRKDDEVLKPEKIVVEEIISDIDIDLLSAYMRRSYLLFKAGSRWHTNTYEGNNKKFDKANESTLNNLRSFAQKLYEDDIQLYTQKLETQKSSDATWRRTVLTSGTLMDKLAAYTLLIQEAPLHNLTYVDTMVTMVSKKAKRESLAAMDALLELFTTELLHPKRKLRLFQENPLMNIVEISKSNKENRDKTLMSWYFESELKTVYQKFIKAVESLCHDTVTSSKQKALGCLYTLLSKNGEQEKLLLCMLINKLGDPDHKTASNAIHHLNKLVDEHPNMNTVIVLEVERMLYRSNISVKAQYYAICFMNQLHMTNHSKDLACKLIKIYFSFFEIFVKKGEVDGKMLSALLTGVNRAFPFARGDVDIHKQMDVLYKTVHIVNFNISVQTLMLLHQVMNISDSISDRYYVALYRKMIDPDLKRSSRQSQFLNLIYKSIKSDNSERRIQSFVKRLLQICTNQQPTFICAALILLSELKKTHSNILSKLKAINVFDSDDSDDEHFADIKDEHDIDIKEDPDATSDSSSDDDEMPVKSTWLHRNLSNRATNLEKKIGSYSILNRNPSYSNAESECLVELRNLCCHFHPSVVLFANNIIKGINIDYKGNALEDFTLIRFLDRFVFRNPKEKAELTKMSRKHEKPEGLKALAVNDKKYLNTDINLIPVEEKFFHNYFTEKSKNAKVKEEMDSDDESVGDDEFDDLLDDYEDNLDGKNIDFAEDFKTGSIAKRVKSKNKSEEEDDDLSEEEMDFSDMEGEFSDFDEDDEEGGEDFEGDGVQQVGDDDLDEESAMDSDEEEIMNRSKKAKKSNNANLFAAADEFSMMLDDTANAGYDTITSSAVSNKDNSHAKQLKWEEQRQKKFTSNNNNSKWKSKKGNNKRKRN